MANWILVPCLVQLRTEFGEVAPGRARGADGSVGDLAHQQTTSDHNPDETGAVPIRDADRVNEVHALDITTDLRTPGLSLEMVVQHILARCRSGAERRLRYIIFNRRIWKADNSWRQETYTGTSDPHTGHAHFSASYDTAREASTASWHLEDIPVALTIDDRDWISDEIARQLKALVAPASVRQDAEQENPIGKAAWTQPVPNVFREGRRTDAYVLLGDLAQAVKAATPPAAK